MSIVIPTRQISVSEATSRGVAGLMKDADAGGDFIVTRHGKPIAAVVSTEHFAGLQLLEAELRDAALVVVRAATDSGVRGSLDDTITAFGFDRAELEAELDADLAAGRE